VLSAVFVLVGLVALAVDRPATSLAVVAMVLLIGGLVGLRVAGWVELTGGIRSGGRPAVVGRWSALIAFVLFAGAALLLLLGAVTSG
jgi:hypothetical protein